MGRFCPVFINEMLLDPSHATCLLTVYSYFPATMVGFRGCDRRPCGQQNSKIITVMPFKEKIADSCCKESLCDLRKEIQKYLACERSPKNFLYSNDSLFFIILERIHMIVVQIEETIMV